MEKDNDLWCGNEFDRPLAENYWRCLASLVEVDTETGDCTEEPTAEPFGQLQLTVFSFSYEMRSWETVCSFRSPLLFFTEAPQDKTTSKHCSKGYCEPGAGRDLVQSR